MESRKSKNHSDKTSAILLFLIFSAAAALVGALLLYVNLRGGSTQEYIADDYPKSGVSLEQTTEELDTPSDTTDKDIISAPPADTTGQPEPKKSVKPVITFAQQSADKVEVSAFIDGIFEEGGSCTAQFTKQGESISGSSQAFKDASTTICGVVTLPAAQFSKGEWNVKITYASTSAEGVSDERSFSVD